MKETKPKTKIIRVPGWCVIDPEGNIVSFVQTYGKNGDYVLSKYAKQQCSYNKVLKKDKVVPCVVLIKAKE